MQTTCPDNSGILVICQRRPEQLQCASTHRPIFIFFIFIIFNCCVGLSIAAALVLAVAVTGIGLDAGRRRRLSLTTGSPQGSCGTLAERNARGQLQLRPAQTLKASLPEVALHGRPGKRLPFHQRGGTTPSGSPRECLVPFRQSLKHLQYTPTDRVIMRVAQTTCEQSHQAISCRKTNRASYALLPRLCAAKARGAAQSSGTAKLTTWTLLK